ncbi:MAG TPA: hypothetical protein DDZ81_01835 [Acetobacteraceae bacterium]|jgi:uncharacterized protein YhaN|nr:hypothetical protein [Acetobacteraceae bacterium]
MRLAHFRLERYGPFEQLDLPLDAAPGRVNLIVASNGYGKSVLRHGIGEFLFGIEPRTPMSFRFGTERMLLKAEITHDGGTQSLVRRKGNGITLARGDGTPIQPEEERRLLGGADKTLFQELFGLDTALLRSGGGELIRSHGRLGQVLFAAGGGMAPVRDLLTELERRRDELGKATARHKTRPLWGAFSGWEQANIDLRRSAMRPDGWHTLERQATESARELEILLREQADHGRERERLRTIGACRPWLDRLRAASLVLAEAGGAPELDDGFEKRWRDALQAGVITTGNAEAARLNLQAARDTRATLSFDPAWIAARADIAALADLRGVAAQSENDLPGVEREHADEQATAARIRRDLGWDAAVPLPPVQVVKDAQRRLRLHPKLEADADSAAKNLEAANRALAETAADLAALPTQGNVAGVSDLVALLRADGDPAARMETARRRLREAEAALRTALAAIPDSPLPEAALATTAAPSEAKLEAAGQFLNQAETAYNQAVRNHAARMDEIDTEQARLTALEQSAMLPPADALAQTRATRDALWVSICRAERPEPGAAVTFDRAMRDADAIADALIRHGREAAEATALRGRVESLEAGRPALVAAMAQTAAQVADARGGLLAMARAAGGNAADLPGLRIFLKGRERALACQGARDSAATELDDLTATLRALGERLAAAMGVPPRDLAELGALLAEASRTIAADGDLANRRTLLTEQARRDAAAKATAVLAAEKACQALTEWSAGWDGVAAELSRPAQEAPAITGDAIAQIEELRKAEAAITEKQIRIDGMRAAIDRFGVKVAHLGALAPDLATLPPLDAAERFRQRIQAELQQAARCADADQRIAEAEAKLTIAVTEAESAARTLLGLRAALRAATNDEAEHQLQRARLVSGARNANAEASRELAVQGGGLSVETLESRAAETTADADAERIAAIDRRQQELEPLIDSARNAAQTAKAALEQAGNGLDAAEAAQRRESAQAMLARTAEEALVLHAAHAMLQMALDRQAAHADQPLLARIGDVFRSITGGVQGGVRVEDTRDGQTMMALESDGVTRKALDQLSEGTSDQLYLALRIAALEDYAATASPLPFIADDILQTFDDTRTLATLRVLATLSAKVQVIVLTHHPHVAALAATLPEDVVRMIPLAA